MPKRKGYFRCNLDDISNQAFGHWYFAHYYYTQMHYHDAINPTVRRNRDEMHNKPTNEATDAGKYIGWN